MDDGSTSNQFSQQHLLSSPPPHTQPAYHTSEVKSILVSRKYSSSSCRRLPLLPNLDCLASTSERLGYLFKLARDQLSNHVGPRRGRLDRLPAGQGQGSARNLPRRCSQRSMQEAESERRPIPLKVSQVPNSPAPPQRLTSPADISKRSLTSPSPTGPPASPPAQSWSSSKSQAARPSSPSDSMSTASASPRSSPAICRCGRCCASSRQPKGT